VGGFNTLSKKTMEQLKNKMENVDYTFENEMTNLDLSLFDALIIEYNPNITSLIRKIKAATNSIKHRQQLILTGAFHTYTMAIAMHSGVNEFLAKPIGCDEILALIKKVKQNTNQ
jgi:ActR/RegA family two-component response regulator